jgi:cytochrome c oxidase accessory protein FixG
MHLSGDTDTSFRDKLGIVTAEGKRKFIYPKKPSGKFYKLRTYFSYLLLIFMIIMPLIKIDGHPVMLFNVIDRKFIIFGQPFGTGDFFILALGFITFMVFIILFTVILGRVFCGWACPQTVFLEMVFRKIENLIEGDYIRQKQFNQSPWTLNKLFRKLLKWGIFYIISVIIANILLSWIIGIDELMKIISEPLSLHLSGFIIMLIFSSVFFFIFAWFREYACIYVCPYGRLQGVLLDKDTTVIAYDFKRGEPRGKIQKGEERNSGDCIDCGQCVAVCPTGIDIRNGTQLECVNCAACIDACDYVMDKINKPRGLIKYASYNNILNNNGLKFTAREKAYSVILILLIVVLGVLLAKREVIDITLLRTPGSIYQQQPDGRISNLYSLKIVNKTFEEIPLSVKLENVSGEIKIIGSDILLPPNDVSEWKFLITMEKEKFKLLNKPVEIGFYTDKGKYKTIQTTFMGPR